MDLFYDLIHIVVAVGLLYELWQNRKLRQKIAELEGKLNAKH